MTKENQIMQKLFCILQRDFEIPVSLSELNTNTPLLHPLFGMDAVALTYLILIVQEEFGITIPPECFEKYGLLTLESIAKILLIQ